ncbi:MAG: hypothetical protein ACXW18_11200, partial [Pyrinomonadaceae bacterium]
NRRAFDIAALSDGKRNFFVGDQIFDRIVRPGLGDFGATPVAKFLPIANLQAWCRCANSRKAVTS